MTGFWEALFLITGLKMTGNRSTANEDYADDSIIRFEEPGFESKLEIITKYLAKSLPVRATA